MLGDGGFALNEGLKRVALQIFHR
ncbi:uncharacterized protein METZ01_LOCUS301570 [marine metagenome]|uniref:Uncharacterized protein n=1 Tax=marine metagenome TaxID=408172 RepID=A0A382MIZ2_9ZZZZ